MKSVLVASLTSALLITGCSKTEEPAATAGMPAASATMEAMPQAASTATTKGTIKAVDSEAGKITISHEPVPALEWPAMTMAFEATPEQIAAVKVGQEVKVDFEAQGMNAKITSISAAP